MPRISSYTPPWLARPSAGSRIFTDLPGNGLPASPSKRSSQNALPNVERTKEDYQGPRKLLANRGTEIFAVVGNKIRWADLPTLRDNWEEESGARKPAQSVKNGMSQHEDSVPYRVLTVPVYQQIRQIIISPSEIFLAVLTEHTVHVAVLPDPSHLTDTDRSPLKLKTYQLGPTTHVIPQSPTVTALWHPLAASSYSTDCLVTVTAESAVRVWELDRANQWSFDRPALAIDLKKLVDGTSCDQDFEPSAFGKNRGFSADVFDMEATSACFGGFGLPEEDGWAAMTLWVGMRNGGIYALCPLLPSEWRPSTTTIPALSTGVVARLSCAQVKDLDPEEEGALRQQFEWVQEIDNAAPLVTDFESKLSPPEENLLRPSNPSAIPRLQGPFDVELGEDDDDVEISDIHVVAAKLDIEDLLSGDEVEFADIAEAALSDLAATVICLATTDGVMHVLLDTEGVSGQWLPKAGSGTFAVPVSDAKELILVDSLEFNHPEGLAAIPEWPMFSSDITSRYNLYITSSQQVTFMSFGAWASRIDAEISGSASDTSGLALRLQAACEGPVAIQEQVLTINEGATRATCVPLSAPVVFEDPELGHMLLTCSAFHPYAVSFDQPQELSPAVTPTRSHIMSLTPVPQNIELIQASAPLAMGAATPRSSYEPHPVFYEQPSAPLKSLLTMNVPQRQKMTLKQEIRLSPATLDVVSFAHRTLATQTSQLETAAADLFRRCDRLREELSNQVKHMSELSSRMQRLDDEDQNEAGKESEIEKRLERARARQQSLSARHEALRRKVARAGTAGRDLSVKEMNWAQEIDDLARTVGIDIYEEEDNEQQPARGNILDERFHTIKQLAGQLLEQAKTAQKDPTETDFSASTNSLGFSTSSGSKRSSVANSGMLVSSKLQKAKIAEAMTMVERESAVIEAVMARLERLNVDQ